METGDDMGVVWNSVAVASIDNDPSALETEVGISSDDERWKCDTPPAPLELRVGIWNTVSALSGLSSIGLNCVSYASTSCVVVDFRRRHQRPIPARTKSAIDPNATPRAIPNVCFERFDAPGAAVASGMVEDVGAAL